MLGQSPMSLSRTCMLRIRGYLTRRRDKRSEGTLLVLDFELETCSAES